MTYRRFWRQTGNASHSDFMRHKLSITTPFKQPPARNTTHGSTSSIFPDGGRDAGKVAENTLRKAGTIIAGLRWPSIGKAEDNRFAIFVRTIWFIIGCRVAATVVIRKCCRLVCSFTNYGRQPPIYLYCRQLLPAAFAATRVKPALNIAAIVRTREPLRRVRGCRHNCSMSSAQYVTDAAD